MSFTGHTLLITGGGSGIGRALAEALHDQGNTVIIAGRRRAALEAVAAGRPGLHWREMDIADGAAIPAFAEALARDFPALNGLVNNAGIMRAEDLRNPPGYLADAEETIATNLLGPLRLTATLLPHLLRQPSATVMNVTSGLAFVPLVATPTYCATKAALHSYSQSLRAQLRGTPVRVIELPPPAVATTLMPGHDSNPNSMPLAEYIAETMQLLNDHPDWEEVCVRRVRLLREAEANGTYAAVFAQLNDGAH